ncbi:glycosyltransferase family 4 protein [Mucilaginibacter sp. UR6-1]|uniref:glycosyltransferase family 4 protein n=1 Tax=Mucilaginibacter sp. UR6-1 TaxID=1435643 RepID=UPI001E3BE147|nr:glycosyltransferase family 4 protein [Mucilaginibacter sp. UR6-1]MCC8409744.1 glycosyltransferase family 4 protein [Mucilaginibacter sp. UR6-1]
MEILFVSHKHPPATGGMEKQSYELVRGMKKHARIHAIVYKTGTSKLRFFMSLNRRIVAMCRKYPGISVIHYNDGLMAAICMRHKGYEHLKRTVTLHGLDVVFPNNTYRRSVLPEYKKFDKIFAVSNATANACIKYGIPAEKIKVISNGVDASIADCLPQPALVNDIAAQHGLQLDNKRVLICMGRAVKRKGFAWLIKHVMPALSDDFTLLIIGPFKPRAPFADKIIRSLPPKTRRQVTSFLGWPTDEEEIRRLLQKSGTANRVKHLGRLPFEDILQLLMAAEAFIMPNIRVPGDLEGFGLVCLEACLCGTKVFASNIEGIKDVISHGHNGYLLPAANKAAWIDALSKLNSQPRHYKLQPKQIKAYTMKHFGWDKMVKEYLDCFEELTAMQPAPFL